MSVNRSVSPPCGSAIARHYRDRFRSCRRAWRTPPRSATCAMWRCRMPPTTASSCTSCTRFGAAAPSKRCTAAWSSPGPGHSPSPCRCPTQAPPAPAPARWISGSGSLAAGSPSTAQPDQPRHRRRRVLHLRSPPRQPRNAPNRGESPDFPLLELELSRSHCDAPTARAGLTVPHAALAASFPSTGLAPRARMRCDELDLFGPGRGPRTAAQRPPRPPALLSQRPPCGGLRHRRLRRPRR